MSATTKTIDMKLQVRVEDASSGTSKVKNLNFSKIKVSATSDELVCRRKCDRIAPVSPAFGPSHGSDQRPR